MSSDILAASSSDLVEQYALSAGRLVVQAAYLMSKTDPKGALDGLRRHRELLADAAQTVDTEFIDMIRDDGLADQPARGLAGSRAVTGRTAVP